MVRNLEWHAANGDVIRFANEPPFFMSFFDPGASSGSAETARGIRSDGQTTYHVVAEPLTPTLTGTILAIGDTFDEEQRNLDELRRRLQSALDPKHFGTLIYNTRAGSFRLKCRPLAGAQIERRFANSHNIDIDWESDDPYWTSKDPESLSVGIIKKLWRFPWVIAPTVFGSILSYGTIHNPTNTPIFPIITFFETESTRVTVGNRTTGEYTTITHTIAQGQSLRLDMSVPSAVLIKSDGTEEDVTHWTTVDSVFPWVAIPGDNDIYSNTDNPELSPVITLSWYRPEVGI